MLDLAIHDDEDMTYELSAATLQPQRTIEALTADLILCIKQMRAVRKGIEHTGVTVHQVQRMGEIAEEVAERWELEAG